MVWNPKVCVPKMPKSIFLSSFLFFPATKFGSRGGGYPPLQHAKGRTGDRPGPCKEATTRRTVTQGVPPPPPPAVVSRPNTSLDMGSESVREEGREGGADSVRGMCQRSNARTNTSKSTKRGRIAVGGAAVGASLSLSLPMPCWTPPPCPRMSEKRLRGGGGV